MHRRPAPARMPQRAGRRALFYGGRVLRPGALQHAEALAQEQQPQLDLQHFQEGGVLIGMKIRQVEPAGQTLHFRKLLLV